MSSSTDIEEATIPQHLLLSSTDKDVSSPRVMTNRTRLIATSSVILLTSCVISSPTTTTAFGIRNNVPLRTFQPTSTSSLSWSPPLSLQHRRSDSSLITIPHMVSRSTDSTADSSSSSSSRSNNNDDKDDVIYKLFSARRKNADMKVPSWLSWLPTRGQVARLKVAELREACTERGLPKSGKKAELQSRLLEWTATQHLNRVENRRSKLESQHDYYKSIRDSIKLPGKQRFTQLQRTSNKQQLDTPLNNDEDEDDDEEDDETTSSSTTISLPTPSSSADYLSHLTRTFHTTTTLSNLQVRNLYTAAKTADQNGDTRTAKRLLLQLLEATPHDTRIIRRLSRLALNDGDATEARRLLQAALRRHPRNAYLWHGLALLERDVAGCEERAREYWREAISVDPTVANVYHAWGRFEHERGNIRLAMRLLKKGVRVQPKNHRLHHALGNLYREAGMVRESEAALTKGMEYGPTWSKSFFCTSLSYVAYEREGIDAARVWLRKGVIVQRKHAQGWLALGQLEESEGLWEEARSVYREAVEGYEDDRGIMTNMRQIDEIMDGRRRVDDPPSITTNSSILPQRSGDHWLPIYKSWARMEESLGNIAIANTIHARAAQVFPSDWRVHVSWATFLAATGRHKKAKEMFERACEIAGPYHADPYRLFAAYELSRGNDMAARRLFYRGSVAGTSGSGSSGGKGEEKEVVGSSRGLAALFHAWARCEHDEWGNDDRARVLFDVALRLAGTGGEMRAAVLHSMARYERDCGNYRLAQHVICLAVNEEYGRDKVENWMLWADLAKTMGDDRLRRQCLDEVRRRKRVLSPEGVKDVSVDQANVSLLRGPEFRKMLCKAPWHVKLFKRKKNESYSLAR